MNKITFLICFCLIFKFSHTIDIKPETAYNYGYNLIKGLATDENNSKCLSIYDENQDKITEYLKEIIQGLNEGKTMKDLMMSVGLKIVLIDGLGDECRLFYLLEIYNKISTNEGIKEVGTNISNNAEEIYNWINNLQNYKNTGDKFYVLGKIASYIFNFYVN